MSPSSDDRQNLQFAAIRKLFPSCIPHACAFHSQQSYKLKTAQVTVWRPAMLREQTLHPGKTSSPCQCQARFLSKESFFFTSRAAILCKSSKLHTIWKGELAVCVSSIGKSMRPFLVPFLFLWGGVCAQLHPSCAVSHFGWDQQLCGSCVVIAATH